MLIGVPKEVYPGENRVALIPAGIQMLNKAGFEVVVQAGAGDAAHIHDDEYRNSGASLAPTAQSLYEQADIILKVRLPQESEIKQMKEGERLFVCLMLGLIYLPLNY